MDVSMEQIKELREKTGAGIMDCKRALLESKCQLNDAVDYLRKKGLASAEKKATRSTSDGLIASYIHAGGKIGVMVEVNCETDFVARTQDFQSLCKDLAMHIAAANPRYVKREDVDESALSREKDVFSTQAKESGKPAAVIEKIVQGKLDRFYAESCLLEQPFIKDPDKTITDLIKQTIAKLGENITVSRFSRFQLGEKKESVTA